MVHFADEHGQRPHIRPKCAVQRLVNHHLLSCLGMFGYGDDLIQLILKMPVTFSWFWYSAHMRFLS